jgi:hypothetical protein
MEANTALIGAKSSFELEAVTQIGVPLTSVVHPANTEGEHTLGLNHTAQQVNLFVLGMLVDYRAQRFQNLFNSLDILGLGSVFCSYVFNNSGYISVHNKFAPLILLIACVLHRFITRDVAMRIAR